MDPSSYARAIETYLCRKNDGHLIRVIGPSFELVSGWAAAGVPFKVACLGIDRYFERYYRKGPRRRPVRIDFCEADVLDAFDEWKRQVLAVPDAKPEEPAGRRAAHVSLPAHLERVVLRLTAARAGGSIGAAFDPLLDRVAEELDRARADPRGVRGSARQALVDRLAALDRELLDLAAGTLGAAERHAFEREADEQLAAFRAAMSSEAYAKARGAAIDALVREHAGLPLVAYADRGGGE